MTILPFRSHPNLRGVERAKDGFPSEVIFYIRNCTGALLARLDVHEGLDTEATEGLAWAFLDAQCPKDHPTHVVCPALRRRYEMIRERNRALGQARSGSAPSASEGG